MTTIERYPPQEPFSEAALAYHTRVMELGARVPAGYDVAYGDDPYQQVTIYETERAVQSVIVFIHGGGWTNGYKEWMAFMAPALTAAGTIFISMGYRLAPLHLFPAGFDDCSAGLMLVRELVGDAPLFVGGHSAGGHYAALLAVQGHWWRRAGLKENPLRGCLPVSGVYDFGVEAGLKVRPRFLGSSDAERDASPIRCISDGTPFLIAHGERDFPHLILQAKAMNQALTAAGNPTEYLVLRGCDHFEASYHAGDASGSWCERAIQFMRRCSPK
jgi:arylformamidase